ncbi:MAG: hypothetical protein FD152_3821 [Xanthobacteraceae bacterium]|nr:MAG: hypothetical protein FD152_3821 [Xanthobacteraceae bacterium]
MKPTPMVTGMATKKTCICGISLDSTPSPMLKTSAKTRNGAESWMAIRKDLAITVVRNCAASPDAGRMPGRITVKLSEIAAMMRWCSSVEKTSTTPIRDRKVPITAPCWPWVGSTCMAKPMPIDWAMTTPAVSSADTAMRAAMPSVKPTAISMNSIRKTLAGRARSMS